MSNTTTSEKLYDILLDSQNYPHKCQNIQLIETHISKVYLTGDFAYKIKKPVDFGFLNFTKLEDRHYFCKEEIRLNSRLAPSLYLEVVPISIVDDGISFKGHGNIIEYAVKMNQFDTELQLDNQLNRNELDISLAPKLASLVAKFHKQAITAEPESNFGLSEQVYAPMQQNFDQIRPMISMEEDIKNLKTLEAWTQKTLSSVDPLLQKRKQDGFIKECHGDMHLGNMTIYKDELQIFDGIEFNDDFKWIDTTSEIAFFCMDLEFQGADSFSNVFLNHYLENNGDYAMLALLNFYKVYRALVRAKIALFTAGSMDAGSDAFNAQWDNYHQYILLALSYTQTKNKQCFITFGVSGSGKSYVSEQMIQHTPLIRIRSDIERKRYFANADKNTLYSEETTLKTYQLLIKISQMILTSGISVIVDATFIKQTQRQLFNDLCHKMNTPLTILAIETTKDVLEKRLTARATDSTNVSDADIKIMQQQLATLEPLNDNEVHLCKQILNNDDANQLKSQLYTLFN